MASDCRYALRDNELTVHQLDGNTERRVIGSGAELRTVLEQTFQIALVEAPELQAVLDRIACGRNKQAPP